MKDKRLKGRITVLSLAAVLFAIVACGALVMNREKSDIAALAETAKATRLKQVEVENARSALQYELSIADSDSYIAEKARTLYGYLLPGEIRFQVTNPEALYGGAPEAKIAEEGK